MSDYLPFEIQVEIIKKLPVKSLLQFRSVSKSWKSLIDNSTFITDYRSQQQHLIVLSYDDSIKRKYVSFVDDETFPHQQQALVTIPQVVDILKWYMVIGCSNGLLCLYGLAHEGFYGPVDGKSLVVIWNPIIRKAVVVVLPNVSREMYTHVLGFGCGENSDPKIVKIRHISRLKMDEAVTVSSIPFQVEIFTLSTGCWRSPKSDSNLPRKTLYFDLCALVVDGFLYWLVIDRVDDTRYDNLIVSFDMKSEEFREVKLPDRLAHRQSNENLYLCKLRESLVLLERDDEEIGYVVWMMGDVVSKAYTKLYAIHTPGANVCWVLEFRKSGEPVLEVQYNSYDGSSIYVYEPYSKHINKLEINGTGSYRVCAYMETLLLLDQPAFIIYDQGTTLLPRF